MERVAGTFRGGGVRLVPNFKITLKIVKLSIKLVFKSVMKTGRKMPHLT